MSRGRKTVNNNQNHNRGDHKRTTTTATDTKSSGTEPKLGILSRRDAHRFHHFGRALGPTASDLSKRTRPPHSTGSSRTETDAIYLEPENK